MKQPSHRMSWFLAIPVLAIVFYQQQIKSPHQDSHRNDLKHLYLGSRLLLEGKSPYPYDNLVAEAAELKHPHFRLLNPYVYPPFTGYFFGWFGHLEYDRAVEVWFWGSQFLLAVSMVLLWGSLSVFSSLQRVGVCLATVAISFPLFRATSAGQLDHFLLCLLCLVIFLWRHGFRKAAGVTIGFAALIKVVPAFLLVWLLWKREWAAFAAGVATCLALVLLPATAYGLGPYFEYLDIVKQMGFGSSTWSEQGASFFVDPGNIAVPALIYRTLCANPVTQCWLDLGRGAWFLSVLWALLVLAICLASCRIRRRDEDAEMEIATWIWGMLLIPSLFWDHYLVLAIPCFLLVVARLAEEGSPDWALGLVSVCWLICSAWIVWFNEAYLSGLGILFLNVTTPAALVLFSLCAFLAATSQRHIDRHEKLHF